MLQREILALLHFDEISSHLIFYYISECVDLTYFFVCYLFIACLVFRTRLDILFISIVCVGSHMCLFIMDLCARLSVIVFMYAVHRIENEV